MLFFNFFAHLSCYINVKFVFLGAPNMGGLEMLMNMFGGLGAGSLAAPRSDGYTPTSLLFCVTNICLYCTHLN